MGVKHSVLPQSQKSSSMTHGQKALLNHFLSKYVSFKYSFLVSKHKIAIWFLLDKKKAFDHSLKIYVFYSADCMMYITVYHLTIWVTAKLRSQDETLRGVQLQNVRQTLKLISFYKHNIFHLINSSKIYNHILVYITKGFSVPFLRVPVE